MQLRRITGLIATSAILIASFVAPAGAESPGIVEQQPLTPGVVAVDAGMVDETPHAYFVELASPPAVEGTSAATLKQEKDDFRKNANAQGVKFQERFAYDTLFNGLSISVPVAQASALSRIPGVKAVYPVVTVARPPVTETPAEPDLFTAINMTGAGYTQNELGFTGKGVKVAVMDTGIDYNHPDLGGGFGPGYKVFTGWDFVGDAYNADSTAATYNPVPAPDADPMDCAGHGSHVAGIIGANGVVKGVAPDVTFGAYRVFGCEGSTEADIMLAAMEKIKADGMQVMNMSIGSSFQWPQYPTAKASDRLVNSGVVVVASFGNSGANGLYSGGAPGVGEKVIGVASFDNTSVYLPQFTVTPDGAAFGYVNATAAPTAPTAGSFALARTGTQTTANDGCNALPAGSLAGKVALIRRGTCTFFQKAYNAQVAGAAGVVLYNNAPAAVNPTVAGTVPITIPVVMISQAQGNMLDSRLAAGPVTMTWTDTKGSYPNATAGRISDFSSYGLSPDLTLKPDIGAPGGSIYSTYPLAKGGYATLSGTSMASPHVAGAVALLLQARPNTPSQAVRTMLQNYAEPKNWWGNPALGFLDNVHRQGAGMLQIDKTILGTARVEPAKLSLGESEAGPSVQTLTITNQSAADVTYDISHAPALSTGPNTFTPSFQTGFASVAFSANSITVPAGATAQVTATITAPALANKSMYGGYIVFAPQGGGDKLRVPYAGFVGDYQSIQALSSGGYGFPWLSKAASGSYSKQGDGAVYSMAGGDLPYVLFHLDHQVQKLRIEVKDAVTGKDWHRADDEQYVGRNSTAGGYFTFAFDGTTFAGNKTYTVPDGKYVLTVSVLKALGDESNPAHWETWTSPAFEIKR